jgi:uncharacterized repeat protein (TIGR03803 family)
MTTSTTRHLAHVKLACVLLAALLVCPAAPAQTFQVLHNFTGGRDGANPYGGLAIDRAGNLYGTASTGGNQISGCNNDGATGCGAVFELSRAGSGWILKPLYDFQGGNDFGGPGYGVVIGPDGALYGISRGAGNCVSEYDCGAVFRLAPPPTRCAGFSCSWQETVLHQFGGMPDGSDASSPVIFDGAGNLYGVTYVGGANNVGAVYQLSPDHGSWTENVIYSFTTEMNDHTVHYPQDQLAIDPMGNVYGAAGCNQTLGCFYGAVWQLQPSPSGWTVNTLYQFNGSDGYGPHGVFRDPVGNVYGVTYGGSGNESGTIYELSPSNGGWIYGLVYDFGFEDNASGLVMDSAGNLYGVYRAQLDPGYVFKLTRVQNGWVFTTLHTFNAFDGAYPEGQVVLDGDGNLYGTTISGGTSNNGVVWEITP